MQNRIKKIQSQFSQYKIDCFIVFKKEHVRYLTGLIVSVDYDAICIISKDSICLITDFRYQEEIFKLSNKYNFKVKIKKQGNCFRELKNVLKDYKNIGLDSSASINFFNKIKKELSNNKLILIDKLVERVSAIKTEGEIKNIKKALKITETVFEKYILPIIKPGITEIELAAEITYRQKLLGAEADSFQPIVLSGAHSSLPHGSPGNQKIKKGILQFDFGCIYNGYCSDFSRVVFVGKPTKKQIEIYDIVLDAQKKAIQISKPGLAYSKLDKTARDYIVDQGYSKNFEHALGHGIGITCHALPVASSTSNNKMEPGNVITIEPGIYIPGWGGIRIEDMILVRDNGIENLTNYYKEIKIID